MPNVIDGAAYSKEYKGDDSAGQDALCVQRSAATSGQRVVLVDDLVATGGTLMAGVDLVKSLVRGVTSSLLMSLRQRPIRSCPWNPLSFALVCFWWARWRGCYWREGG